MPSPLREPGKGPDMYADASALTPWSFTERMSDAKDAALHRDHSRVKARVLERPGPLIEWWTVAHVADLLGVTETRVKVLAATGRFGRCKRSKVGKGRAWLIPAHWQSDNTYKLKLERGKRGPVIRALLLSPGHEEVPF